ncbi:MAG: hypothetical protein JXA77_00395 [Bacteroidales bacterium]|nr:hypothetical protein [Bacteroidales bacterium]MBN2817632.1 hypothetical protein [Bacteroidales bacterium]
MNILSVILILLLIHILYTDFRWYKVNLLVICCAILISSIRLFNEYNIISLISNLGLNLLLLSIIFAAVFMASLIKKKKFFELMGSGDVLFFFIAALSFAPLVFNLYLTIAALLGLLLYLINTRQTGKNNKIPFAGLMSLVLIGFMLVDLTTEFSCYNDNLFFNFIAG